MYSLGILKLLIIELIKNRTWRRETSNFGLVIMSQKEILVYSSVHKIHWKQISHKYTQTMSEFYCQINFEFTPKMSLTIWHLKNGSPILH